MKFQILNEKQKQNLQHLRNFIVSVPPETFEMGTYCARIDSSGGFLYQYDPQEFFESPNMVHQCGSAMCLLGWSASVPELTPQLPIKGNSIEVYWPEVGRILYGHDDTSSEIGEYLFSSVWSELDSTNTIEHALYRIDKVLAAETEEDYNKIKEELQLHEDSI